MRLYGPVVLLMLLLCAPVEAGLFKHRENRRLLAETNARLVGQVVDFTANHGPDNRIWSPALDKHRDLYVYLPPGYDPTRRYPLMLWLHGVAQDELSFLKDVIGHLDRAIVSGKIAPIIIAAPDGSVHGQASNRVLGSFYMNTKAGPFEDYLMTDVWNFIHEHFPIRPEREAHILAGVSMGAGAAYRCAFKYRDRCKHVIGIDPPLNMRWESTRGRYSDDFTGPESMNFRTDFSRGREVMARFYGIPIKLKRIMRPLYGREPNAWIHVAAENPLELMIARNIKDEDFNLYIGYAGRDEFNIDAQVESFLYFAKLQGIRPQVVYFPEGRHDRETALSFVPSLLDWMEPLLAPYKPVP